MWNSDDVTLAAVDRKAPASDWLSNYSRSDIIYSRWLSNTLPAFVNIVIVLRFSLRFQVPSL